MVDLRAERKLLVSHSRAGFVLLDYRQIGRGHSIGAGAKSARSLDRHGR
jgi:hypothetical protein